MSRMTALCRLASMGAVTLCLAGADWAAPQAQPFAPDEHTVLLLHFDEETTDASGANTHVREIGEVSYADGRFGQALACDGNDGVVYDISALHIGNQNWTVECWFKMPKPDVLHASLIQSPFAFGKGYALRVSNENCLSAVFSYGGGGTAADTKPMPKRLFDCQWHHAAMVLDRQRNGEVRLYFDGELAGIGRRVIPCPHRNGIPANVGPHRLDRPRRLQGCNR